MKVSNLVLVALSWMLVVGCGSSQDTNNTAAGTPAAYNPAAVVPPGSLPIGQYQNQYGQYSPCPINYVQSGNYCIQNTNGYGNGYNNGYGNGYGSGYGTGYGYCQSGAFWNGYGCQPIGVYNCPAGYAWSNIYYQCVGASYYQGSYPSNCKVHNSGIFYSYVCY